MGMLIDINIAELDWAIGDKNIILETRLNSCVNSVDARGVEEDVDVGIVVVYTYFNFKLC